MADLSSTEASLKTQLVGADEATTASVRDLASANPLDVAIVDSSGNQLSTFPVTTDIAKLEDAAHVSGDAGVQVLAVRTDSPNSTGPLAGATGDYSPVMTDSKGALRTSGGLMKEVTGSLSADGVIIASTDCTDFRFVSVQITGIFTAAVDFECSNDNSTFKSCTLALASGLGASTSASSLEIYSGIIPARYFRCSVSSYLAGTVSVRAEFFAYDGTNHVTLDQGSNTIGSINSVSSITNSITPGVGAANLGKAEDAAHASGNTGVMALAVRNDSNALLAGTDLDYIPFSTDNTGALRVTGGGGTEFAEDAAHSSGALGGMTLGVRTDSPATTGSLTSTDGDYTPMQMDKYGGLHNSQGIGLEVTGTGTAVNQTPIAATDIGMFRYFSCQITGTFSATIQFEGSNDNSNWVAVSATGNEVSQIVLNSVATTGIFHGSTYYRYFRARVSAYTSGTVTARCEFFWSGRMSHRVFADTEDAAPTALTDAAINPTTTRVGACTTGFNGSTWDRIRTFSSTNTSLGWGSLRTIGLGWAQVDADDGKMYSANTDAVSVTAGATSNVLVVKSSATKKTIIDQIIVAGAPASTTTALLWQIFITPTVSVAGTGVTPTNVKQGGAAATTVVEKTCTTSANGTLIYNAATTIGAPQFALNLPTLSPLYTIPSETATYRVLVKVTNGSAGTVACYCQVNFREN